MSAVFAKWGEWIRFSLTLAAIGSFALLDNRFVSQLDYRRDREKQDSTMQALQTSMALVEASLKTVTDHESRLRALEHGGKAISLLDKYEK